MTTTGPQKGRNVQDADYHRAYHVKTGKRRSIRIPVPVLAATIRDSSSSPLVQHLGPEMVEAITEAPTDE
jgi:hypothetical protein